MFRFNDGGDEAVAEAREGFNEAWAGGGVAQQLAEFVDGGVEILIVVDVGIGPEAFAKGFARDDAAGILEEQLENKERLFLQAQAQAVLTEFAGLEVHLKNAKARQGNGNVGAADREGANLGGRARWREVGGGRILRNRGIGISPFH